MKKFNLLLIFKLLLCSSTSVFTAEINYPRANLLFTRAISVGGAFTGVKDEIESSLYNPAAIKSIGIGSKGLLLYFNPVSAGVSAANLSELSISRERGYKDLVAMLGLILRSIAIAPGPFQFSFVLTEDLSGNPYRFNAKRYFTTDKILDWHYHLASARIQLARQVAIGASLFFFNMTESIDGAPRLKTHVGTNYGILLSPGDRFSVGISFFNIPAEAEESMYQQHQIHHQSINFGIAYEPFSNLHLAVDFRNLSEEDANSGGELHGGIEVVPFSFLTLRSGYFHDHTDQTNNFTFGLGIADFRAYKPVTQSLVFSKILLNYGLQFHEKADDHFLFHHVTLLIRL